MCAHVSAEQSEGVEIFECRHQVAVVPSAADRLVVSEEHTFDACAIDVRSLLVPLASKSRKVLYPGSKGDKDPIRSGLRAA